jgi:endonuclease YncB( thermonuclease family)
MYCDTARAIEVTLRVDAGGEATVWANPPLADGPIVKEPSSMSQTVSLQAPPESWFTSVTIEGTGVGIESFSVTTPFVPRVPAGSLRIIDARLPTASQPIDHDITLMALEGGSYEGYTVRWIDAVTPGASELYANISKIDLKPGQRLRVVPGRASAQAVDDALVQAGGSGTTTPSRTGAVYQLVDPVGTVIHEHAVMPTTSIKPSALVALPNSDGARAFLVPRGNAQSIGRGYWDVRMKLTGDAGPDLDRWSIAGVPIAETAVLRFVIFAAAQPQQTITGKVVAIANGDTLTVLDASNKQHKIRLDGIDAPESWQDFRSRAKQSLSDLVFGKTVTVISSKKDRYGRTLGKVMLRGRNINLEQIQRGMAWFYLQYAEELSPEDWAAYWRAENAAQEELAGLWRGPSPTPPWLFRRGGRSAAPGPIIGNRASKIYHLPNCPDYSKVSERNRVPFKSGAEAQAAGYRRARNCSQ